MCMVECEWGSSARLLCHSCYWKHAVAMKHCVLHGEVVPGPDCAVAVSRSMRYAALCIFYLLQA